MYAMSEPTKPKSQKTPKAKTEPNSFRARYFGQSYKLPVPSGDVKFSLCWEKSTRIFWEYRDGVWTSVERDDLLSAIRSHVMEVEPWNKYTTNTGEDIIKQLKYEVESRHELDDGWIAFNDGVWNPDTDEFAEHAPRRFATVKVNADYLNLPDYRTAKDFMKYLDDICVDEKLKPLEPMRLLLQEIAGYVLLADSERGVSFFLSGNARNGKGVFLDLIRCQVSPERVSNMSLTQLTTSNFSTSALVGKRVNVADETNTSKEAVADIFKKLVTVDTITGERKYGDKFNFKPRCKYFFNVNGIPTFDGFDLAVKERIIAVPFHRFFSKEERDWTLKKRIIANEMPQFVAWAIEGLRRLMKNRLNFTTYRESEMMLNAFENASSSVAEFYSEGWKQATGKGTPTYVVKGMYDTFCKETRRKEVSSNRFTRETESRFGKSDGKVMDKGKGYPVPSLNVERVFIVGEGEIQTEPLALAFGGKVVDEAES